MLGVLVVCEFICFVEFIEGIYIIFCGKDIVFIYELVLFFKEELEKYFLKYQVLEDLNDVVDQDILKVMIYDKINFELNSYFVFCYFENCFKVKVLGKVWFDIFDKVFDKGKVILIVQYKFDI